MEAYQEDVILERDQLAERVGQLKEFCSTKKFAKLDLSEKRRINAQSHAMSQYLQMLNERIKAFTNAR